MPANDRTNFPPSFYANYMVGSLNPEQQDELLANGWFRNDVNVFASSVKFMGSDWRSCVMLRLPLENFTWKKRLRKLVRKNGEVFTVAVRPFYQSAEKEVLWQGFKREIHNWVMIPQLYKHLLRNAKPRHFNTWELCVYDGDKLVAFSIFDRGKTSIASLEAAYDPEYARFSLGIYTMMMEIDFALQEGLSFYYPGFFPKNVPMFEYKLRPGSLEFFRLKEKEWLPLDALEEADWLLEPVLDKFESARFYLVQRGFAVSSGFGFYPSKPGAQPFVLDYNLLLVVSKTDRTPGTPYCLIAWDPVETTFMVFTGLPMLSAPFWEPKLSGSFFRLLDVKRSRFISRAEDMEALLEAVGSCF